MLSGFEVFERLEEGIYNEEDLAYLSDKWELASLLESVKEEWFPQLEYSRLISEISGGEFANLGLLARLQIVKTGCLLLDEPSNQP